MKYPAGPWSDAVSDASSLLATGDLIDAAENYELAATIAEAVQAPIIAGHLFSQSGLLFLQSNLPKKAIGPTSSAVDLLARSDDPFFRDAHLRALGNKALAMQSCGYPIDEIISIHEHLVSVLEGVGTIQQNLGNAYLNLADSYRAAGERDKAHASYDSAVSVFSELGMGDAVHRSKLGRSNTKPSLRTRLGRSFNR